MKSYGNALRLLLVILIVLGIGSAVVSAQEKQTSADTEDCILFKADGYIEDEADDAAGEDADEEGDVDEGGDDDDNTGGSGEDDANEGDDADDADEDGEDEDEAGITGSIAVDEAALDGLTAEARCDALTSQATISLEEAQAAAEAETGAVVVQVELDVENGFLVYSVDMEDGTGVTVDAGNGDILATEADADDEAEAEAEADEDDTTVPANTGITADEAQAIAEAETGGTAREVEFEIERGVEIWEVEMQDGTEVQVNASDGTIILIEEGDDD